MNEAKRFLMQYQWQIERVRQLEETIDKINAKIESISLDNDGMPRGSGISDKTGRLAVQLADALTKCEIMIAEAWQIREEIEEVINAVPYVALSLLLYERYINNKNWAEIADKIGYTETYTRGRLHQKALEEAAQFIKDDAERIL